ncbi:MAG: DUF222 domain-containing protein [Nocardioidaceae bacterium]
MHEPVDPGSHGVSMWWEAGQALPLAGAGAPMVMEFAVAELAAALGLSTDAGRTLIGQALDLAFRLPATWDQVRAGRVPAWKARRFADQTRSLSQAEAAFVDDQLAAVTGKVTWAQLDRLITEAVHRHLPQTLDDPDQAPATVDRRRVTVDLRNIGLDGVITVEAALDTHDALDLEQALHHGAEQLKLAGSPASLDARRAAALGEMARHELTLTLPTPGEDATPMAEAPPQRRGRAAKPVTLYLHLHESALTDQLAGGLAGLGGVGRVENTRMPVTADTIRAWCGDPTVSLTVKPVIDLTQHVKVAQYEIPDRLAERLWLREPSCVFPFCDRPARTACDGDHVISYDHDHPDHGGQTCDCNTAPCCRHHHRLKTLTPWRYKAIEPGVYLWTSPHGYQLLRDWTGTTDITPTGTRPAPGCPDHRDLYGPQDTGHPDDPGPPD